MQKLKQNFAGVLLCFSIAVVAWFLGKSMPIIGGPVFGILLGMLLAFIKRPQLLESGIKYSSKKILQYSIILLGFEMNIVSVVKVGSQSLLIMLFSLSAAFTTAFFVGKALKLKRNEKILIGVGTSICGGSAIAATAPVINAEDKEVAHSISTIFLFNIMAVFIFPALGHLFNMSDTGFGIWAGTAINDTSSVVAAAGTWSDEALKLATIVKLTRTLMIVPITLVLAFITTKKNMGSNNFSFVKVFPWFILGFIGTSIITTTGILSGEVTHLLSQTGKFFIVVAMSAIGLNTNIKQLISNGIKPIILGLSCWFAVASVSIIVQMVLHLW